jgi:hypothetical protein
VPGPELWPTGVWLVPGRHLAIYRRATDQFEIAVRDYL